MRLFLSALYTSAARYPMEERNIIKIGLCVIKRCWMYAEEYKAWIGIKNTGQLANPCVMAMAWRPWTTMVAPLHCTASLLQTLAPCTQPHKRGSRARPTAYPPYKYSWRGSSSSAWPSDNSSHHPTTSTTPPNSNSVVTTTAGTTVEAEAAETIMAIVVATGNNQPCTKANKAVAVGLCVPPCPSSNRRIRTIAIRMAVMSKTPTGAPRAPDEAPSTSRMPHAPTSCASYRWGCTR
jgi:hypothetical protein